jgi:hypothetical protein
VDHGITHVAAAQPRAGLQRGSGGRERRERGSPEFLRLLERTEDGQGGDVAGAPLDEEPGRIVDVRV